MALTLHVLFKVVLHLLMTVPVKGDQQGRETLAWELLMAANFLWENNLPLFL